MPPPSPPTSPASLPSSTTTATAPPPSPHRCRLAPSPNPLTSLPWPVDSPLTGSIPPSRRSAGPDGSSASPIGASVATVPRVEADPQRRWRCVKLPRASARGSMTASTRAEPSVAAAVGLMRTRLRARREAASATSSPGSPSAPAGPPDALCVLAGGRAVACAVCFRPCIDIDKGKVKQIVGSTLRDAPNDGTARVTNFESDKSPAEFANIYKEDGLAGGHVIMLGGDPASCYAALEALLLFLPYNSASSFSSRMTSLLLQCLAGGARAAAAPRKSNP